MKAEAQERGVEGRGRGAKEQIEEENQTLLCGLCGGEMRRARIYAWESGRNKRLGPACKPQLENKKSLVFLVWYLCFSLRPLNLKFELIPFLCRRLLDLGRAQIGEY